MPMTATAAARGRAAPLLALALALAAASAPGQPPFSPGPGFLAAEPGFAELGALPEPLGAGDLARASLLASGLAPAAQAPYLARLDALLEALRAEAGALADPAARGEAILAFLHRRAFGAYREEATRLDLLLDTGAYNCVSSAALYLVAARSLGLEAEGVRTSDHAFCTVEAGGWSIDVETTNPYGFDPGNKKEFKDSFGRATGYAYVAPGGYGDRRAIGARDLVGLILSNRASALERSGLYAEALGLGADYAALCPGPDSRAFLEDRVNNLVSDLESRRDFAGAEAAARAAAAALPGEPRLAALARAAVYNRAAAAEAAGDWEGAFDMAASAMDEAADSPAPAPADGGQAAAAPSPRELAGLARSALLGMAQAYARRGEFALAHRAVADRAGRAPAGAAAEAYALVGDAELVRAANDLPFAEAAAAARGIYDAGEASAERYAQALSAIYGREAARIGSSGDWLAAAAAADEGAALVRPLSAGEGERLSTLARTLRRNFAARAHNEFAALFNAGRYDEAKAAIERAQLALARRGLPADQSLARDLAAAEAAAGKR